MSFSATPACLSVATILSAAEEVSARSVLASAEFFETPNDIMASSGAAWIVPEPEAVTV
jgi:hypothetical protein